MRAPVFATLILMLTVPAISSRAEPSYEQWAANGAEMYDAFRCAALARAAEMPPAEFTRLFNKGMDLGRPLLNAVFEGRVKPRTDLWIMPIGALGCGNGPTAEFVLGRIFQCSHDDALQFLNLETDQAKRLAEAKRSYEANKCEAPT
jgi:hypothetical protein